MKKNIYINKINKATLIKFCNDTWLNVKKYFTKINITYFVLFLFDILLVIYLAKKNVVNYISVFDEKIFISKTKYLLWGRNYVNLVVIAFVYIYGCFLNRFFLKRRNTKKFLLWLLVVLFILNVLLFIIFTKRIY